MDETGICLKVDTLSVTQPSSDQTVVFALPVEVTSLHAAGNHNGLFFTYLVLVDRVVVDGVDIDRPFFFGLSMGSFTSLKKLCGTRFNGAESSVVESCVCLWQGKKFPSIDCDVFPATAQDNGLRLVVAEDFENTTRLFFGDSTTGNSRVAGELVIKVCVFDSQQPTVTHKT